MHNYQLNNQDYFLVTKTKSRSIIKNELYNANIRMWQSCNVLVENFNKVEKK